MSKEKNCPLCGLKMELLSFQLWQCKCGHKEKREEDAEKKDEEKQKRKRRWSGENSGHFREPKQPLYKGVR